MSDSPKAFEGEAFQVFNDPYGNRLSSINRDGTVSVQGINFPDGTRVKTASEGVLPPVLDLGTF